MSVRHFSVDYKKANEHGTFSAGDTLSGQVTVVASGKIKAQCLLVKAKGKAQVRWCEQDGETSAVCGDKRKYFCLEHIILQDKNKGDGSEVIRRGRNVYPFTFVIPNTEMPSTYEGKWGRISYTLRARLTQSIWRVNKAKTEFPFVTKSEFPFGSKAEMIIIGLKKEQSTTKTSFFGSAKVTVSVAAEKMGVTQGKQLEFSVRVLNDSPQSLVPAFCLREKQTFAAQSKRTVHTNDILFETADCVPPRSSQTVTKALRIPPELPPTFFNCCMMKLEYRLRAYLDLRCWLFKHSNHNHVREDLPPISGEDYLHMMTTTPSTDCMEPGRRAHDDTVSISVSPTGSLEVKLPVVILMSPPEPRQVTPKRTARFGKLRQ